MLLLGALFTMLALLLVFLATLLKHAFGAVFEALHPETSLLRSCIVITNCKSAHPHCR
jgi:hypothetical protein